MFCSRANQTLRLNLIIKKGWVTKRNCKEFSNRSGLSAPLKICCTRLTDKTNLTKQQRDCVDDRVKVKNVQIQYKQHNPIGRFLWPTL